MIKQIDVKRLIETAYADETLPTIDIHEERKKSGGIRESDNGIVIDTPAMQQNNLSVPLDFTQWLPRAAPHYHISSNFDDYVMTPVIVMPSDLPNRNSVAFPLAELTAFIPHLGQLAFQTWKGKPTHYEHQNEDITKAYGVIADAFIRKFTTHGGGRVWKVLLLLAFDRTKHPDVVSKILSKEFNSYSMGAFIGSYTCSYCGSEIGHCIHIDPRNPTRMYELNNKLVYRNVQDIEGFECSIVASPAFASASSDTLIVVKK